MWSLTVESGLTPKTERYNREFLVKKEDAFKVVSPGEFIYNPMNMTLGAVDLNSMDKKVAVSGYYITMQTKESHSNSYFVVWLKSPQAIKLYKIFATGGLTEKQRVQFPTLSSIETLVPTLPEQTCIGDFFRTLDNTIALHQRKLDGLKAIKAAYLQQMFPAAGESVPRIRFAGFEDEWEVRRLGEVAEFSKGNGYSKSDLADQGMPIILYGRLYTKYETIIEDVDTFASMKEKSVISRGGEVIVPSSGETAEDISRASVVAKQGVILGGDLNIIRTDSTIHPAFLAITISNGTQQKELSKRAQGKSVVHINNSDLKEVELLCPALPEQTAIGNFFKAVDKNIAAQQIKLDKLKQLKAAYLQKMFA